MVKINNGQMMRLWCGGEVHLTDATYDIVRFITHDGLYEITLTSWGCAYARMMTMTTDNRVRFAEGKIYSIIVNNVLKAIAQQDMKYFYVSEYM